MASTSVTRDLLECVRLNQFSGRYRPYRVIIYLAFRQIVTSQAERVQWLSGRVLDWRLKGYLSLTCVTALCP